MRQFCVVSRDTWTCGVFIAGEKNEIPLAKFYEIPSQKATCPAKFKDTWKKGKFSKKCGKLVRITMIVELNSKAWFPGEGMGGELVQWQQLGGDLVSLCEDLVCRKVWEAGVHSG